jgi:hypothetical protein
MSRARQNRHTVQVVVVLELVAEERARDVDLLATDNGDLLAVEQLGISRAHSTGMCRIPHRLDVCLLSLSASTRPLHRLVPPAFAFSAMQFSSSISPPVCMLCRLIA